MADRDIEKNEIKGLTSGKKVLLLTLVVCAVVPLVAVAVALWLANDLKGVSEGVDERKPLVWSERGSWQIVRVNPTEIEKREGPKPPFEGRVRRELPFALSEGERDEVGRLSEAAKRWEGTVDAGLDELADYSGEAFYGDYLRGRYRLRDAGMEEYEEDMRKAFGGAEKVLAVRYVDENGEVLKGQDVGTVRVICAIKRGGVVDEGVELVFPYEKTDKNGYIYLPVYDTVLRLEGSPSPDGSGGVEYDVVRWFEIPGRVGEVKAVVKSRK